MNNNNTKHAVWLNPKKICKFAVCLYPGCGDYLVIVDGDYFVKGCICKRKEYGCEDHVKMMNCRKNDLKNQK